MCSPRYTPFRPAQNADVWNLVPAKCPKVNFGNSWFQTLLGRFEFLGEEIVVGLRSVTELLRLPLSFRESDHAHRRIEITQPLDRHARRRRLLRGRLTVQWWPLTYSQVFR